MAESFDFSVDPLADAALTGDQRRVWNLLRGELASTQAKNQELLEKLRLYEKQDGEKESTVLNRIDFNREVARMLAFDERYGGMSSILYFDFEGIDEVTQRFGRAVSNAALREIANVLTRGVRTSDITGRLAPDEFGVLLMRCDNTFAWRKAETLSASLQQALAKVHDCELNITISYGAYTFRDNEDLAVGLKEAAQAMTKTTKT
ncbi:MAG: GGDEF domain-containing protein [Bdellovibrionales bacterium]